jgi:UDPglucose 6-dehydrogenase
VKTRIFIIGSGVVGAATGEGFAAAGHDVTFIDISKPRVAELAGRGWDARTEIDLSGEPESLIFLTLPTPNEGHRYDLSAFAAGTAAVGRALAGSPARHTVVVRSTVPPGTTEGLVKKTLEEHSGMVADEGFGLASNPEFLRAVSAAEDFAHPWMTVIAGRDLQVVERLRALLAPFGGELRTFTDPAEAEFIKAAHNIYNATKISFWNEMWLVAQQLGVDLDAIAATVARSAEGSINPQYGIRGGAPYGGVCLPKDTQGFLGFADTIGVDMPLLSAVVETNDRLSAIVSHEVEQAAHAAAGELREQTGARTSSVGAGEA